MHLFINSLHKTLDTTYRIEVSHTVVAAFRAKGFYTVGAIKTNVSVKTDGIF